MFWTILELLPWVVLLHVATTIITGLTRYPAGPRALGRAGVYAVLVAGGSIRSRATVTRAE
jgi:hypothetical protein